MPERNSVRSLVAVLIAIYAYFDRVHVSVQPLSESEEATLRRLSHGRVKIHRRDWIGQPECWRQRIHLWFPITCEALEFLDARGAVPIYVEVALEFIFPTRQTCIAALNFIRRFFRKRYHQGHESDPAFQVEYTGRRWARNNFVTYGGQRRSKVSRHTYCLKCEWRMARREVLASARIRSLRNIRTFNHRAFWQEYRLSLYVPDHDRIGRKVTNSLGKGAQRRQPPKPWESFAQIGRRVFAQAGATTRRFITAWRHRIDVERCLVRLDTELLLPADGTGLVVTRHFPQHPGQSIATQQNSSGTYRDKPASSPRPASMPPRRAAMPSPAHRIYTANGRTGDGVATSKRSASSPSFASVRHSDVGGRTAPLRLREPNSALPLREPDYRAPMADRHR